MLDIRIILYTTNEIIEIGTKPEKHKNGNIKESNIQKEGRITKLTKRTRISCKARKLKKLIILNYTERGKRQQFYKYCYITFILYTVNTYYAFLYINLYISVILTKIVQTIHNVHYCHNLHIFTRKSNTLEYFFFYTINF